MNYCNEEILCVDRERSEMSLLRWDLMTSLMLGARRSLYDLHQACSGIKHRYDVRKALMSCTATSGG